MTVQTATELSERISTISVSSTMKVSSEADRLRRQGVDVVDFGAGAILRGIRAISDYEYELQMALMNRRLRPEIETAFLMAGEAYSFLSSRLVKEVAGLGGDIAGLVPPGVEARLKSRFSGARTE